MRYFLVLCLIPILACSGRKHEAKAEWEPISVFGVSATKPPLVLEAVAGLNGLLAEIYPTESAKGGPIISAEEISVIVDPKEFADSIKLLSPQARISPDDSSLKALAFVIKCEAPIWINWSNPEIQLLQKNYRQGDEQTVYVMASVLAHELGHIAQPKDQYAAHQVQLAVLEEFQKRGRLTRYTQIVENEKIRAQRLHPGSQKACSG